MSRQLKKKAKKAMVAVHNRELEEQVDTYRTAVKTADLNVLRSMIEAKMNLETSYNSTCMCGCIESVSIWETIKNGHAHPSALQFLLTNNCISVDKALDLLSRLFCISGTGETDNFKRVNNCIDVLLHHLANHRDAVVAYKETEHDTTLLHSVFYGYAPDEKMVEWATILLDWGLNPYAPTKLDQSEYKHDPRETPQTPFYMMVTGVYTSLVARVIDEYHVNMFEWRECWRGANLLLCILRKYAKTKHVDYIHSVRDTVQLLVQYGIDLNFVDMDGCNLYDYLIDYGWLNTEVGDLFRDIELKPLSGATRYVEPVSRYSYKPNPSPFAVFMYKERYTKNDMDRLVREMQALIDIYGRPNEKQMERQTSCRDYGDVCVRCDNKGECEYASIIQLIHDFDFHRTPAGNLLRGVDPE